MARLLRKSPLSHPPARLSLAVAIVLFLASAFALAGGEPRQNQTRKALATDKFAGTWQATFNGKVFMTLWLKTASGKLEGTMSNGTMALDKDGNIAEADVQPGSKPIDIESVKGNSLYFSSKTDHPLKLAFTLKDKTHAALTILNTLPPGSPVPKPIAMVRVAPKP